MSFCELFKEKKVVQHIKCWVNSRFSEKTDESYLCTVKYLDLSTENTMGYVDIMFILYKDAKRLFSYFLYKLLHFCIFYLNYVYSRMTQNNTDDSELNYVLLKPFN